MSRLSASLLLLAACAGCQQKVSVFVDCRLAADPADWHLLDGPTYVVRGNSEAEEASLAFQEFAAMLEQALAAERPGLRRVPAGEPAHLILSMAYNVFDRGTGLASYPVYGAAAGYGRWYGGPVYRWDAYGPVGAYWSSVHLGFAHKLFLAAWVPAEDESGRQHVIWEGYSDHGGRDRSLRATLPYLLTALVPYYGRATQDIEEVRLNPDDPRAHALSYGGVAATRPE